MNRNPGYVKYALAELRSRWQELVDENAVLEDANRVLEAEVASLRTRIEAHLAYTAEVDA